MDQCQGEAKYEESKILMVGHEARGCKGWEGQGIWGGDQGERELVAWNGKVAFGVVATGCGVGLSGAGEVVDIEISVKLKCCSMLIVATSQLQPRRTSQTC